MGEDTKTKRKVLIVTTELRAGGTERCVTELAIKLPDYGFQTHVVSLASLPNERDQFVKRLHQSEVKITSLNANSAWHFRRATTTLKRLLLAESPDVVASFLFHGNVITGTALRRQSIPWVANIRVADPRRWRMPLEMNRLQIASKVICVSESVKSYYQNRGSKNVPPMEVIPNGVDVEDIAEQLAKSPKGTPTHPRLGFLGRLDPQKGLDLWLEAFVSVVEKQPAVRFIVVGDGPQRAELETQAKRLGLEEAVVWKGWQERPWEVLGEVDVLVYPSRFEGLSNALLEGMAAGKPLVATSIEGVEEVLGSGPPEQLVPTNDHESMSRSVLQILADKELASKLASWNRAWIEDNYSLDGMIRRFQTVLEDAI